MEYVIFLLSGLSLNALHCSIVAIHGLDGHPVSSWTANNGTFWIHDLLPGKISHARILTYGYDAYTQGGDQLSKETIYDIAKGLVSTLAMERQATDVSNGTSHQRLQFP